MSTAFASVVGAVVAALQAAPAVSAQVDRVRLRPIAKESATAIVVRPLGADADTSVGQGVVGIWATSVTVECYARSGASVSPDVAVDTLLQDAATRLYQNRSLGGLVGDLTLSTVAYDFDVDGDNTACVTLTYQIRHATAAGSLLPT